MKKASLIVLSVLHVAASVSAVTVTNANVTGYDPAELLSKIFSSNSSVESRQRGNGAIKFEDQTDPGIHESDGRGQYGLIDPGQYGLNDPGQYDLTDSGQYSDNSEHNNRFKFEDYDQGYDSIDSNLQSGGTIKFQDSDENLTSNNGGVKFQDDNRVEDQGNKKKKKRRRRRKPKNGVLPYPGAAGQSAGRPGFSGGPGLEGRPGFQRPFQAEYGQNPYGYPGYTTQPFRRPRRPRPRPSLASEALSSITGALTSIALYDDYQCVPRLLCEAAGGGALGSNGALQSIAGIQPLLTLLSAYNGISSSPLFVFGRAVFLGMTSQGNTGTCRYAYPQCPTDPEQLIYYLNNHNGGFFRFFNAPQVPNQNLEQFYNQLGNQGLFQTQQYPSQQGYGYPSNPNPAQNYGLLDQNQQYPNPAFVNQHGQNYGPQKPGLYGNPNYNPHYANDYNYNPSNQIRFKDSNVRIEKRIQNKPIQNTSEDNLENNDVGTKWQFPDEQSVDVNKNNIRDSRTLKFPEEGQDQPHTDKNRKGKQVYFPGSTKYKTNYNNRPQTFTDNYVYQTTQSYNNGQNNQNYYTYIPNTYTNNYKPIQYHNHDYNPSNYNNKYHNEQNYYNDRQNMYNNNKKYQPTTVFNNEEYVFDHKHNFYVKKEKNYASNISNNGFNNLYNNYNNNAYNYNTNNFKRNEDDGLKTVYVVRGNGDPNNPEIVKLRPGQSVH